MPYKKTLAEKGVTLAEKGVTLAEKGETLAENGVTLDFACFGSFFWQLIAGNCTIRVAVESHERTIEQLRKKIRQCSDFQVLARMAAAV